jgi:uncharacterized protein (TIGR00255 family)
VKVSAPKDLQELDHLLSIRIRDTFARGKFEILLKTERLRPRKKSLDPNLVAARWRELDGIRKRLGLKEPVSLEAALGQVSAGGESEEADSGAQQMFVKAAERALSQLRSFRVREGKNLSRDILRRAIKMEAAVGRIGGSEKETKDSRMQKLRTRISELLQETAVDSKRLETEEIVRLSSHIGRLRDLAAAERSVGRELDFLLQEMNREINTIGSKANDLGIVDEVILAKAEIEKIREQVQNLE